MKKKGTICVVVGGQWGDEGKGKLVDILAQKYNIVARATGGANAGHTIYLGEKKFVFHLVPAGMLHKKSTCVMGNGMVVHIPTLIEEIDALKKAGITVKGRLFLSDRAHLVFDYHKIVDNMQEKLKGSAKVGTTGRGIGPAYTDKISRHGIRVGELANWNAFEERYRAQLKILQKMYDFPHDANAELLVIRSMLPRIAPLIADTSLFLDQAIKKGKTVLLEGANGTLLDIDHGTFPFVTSSNASIGGMIAGCGVSPSQISDAVGIMKAYVTRVGSGPFPTELENELGENLRKTGKEFGATTGRPRRCGWFDVVAARYAVRINGLTSINLTKVDVLNLLPSIEVGVAYKYKGKRITEFPADISILENCTVEYIKMPGWMRDISKIKTFAALPPNCKKYISTLEHLVGCPIKYIGTGHSREQMITKK